MGAGTYGPCVIGKVLAPQRYLSILLTELPNVTDVDQVEAILPWNLTPAMVAERYAAYPAP